MHVHDDHIEFPRLKKEYDALDEAEKDRLGYERKLYHLLIDLVSEMDKRIARAKERVDKENQPRPIKPSDQERLDILKAQEKGTLFFLKDWFTQSVHWCELVDYQSHLYAGALLRSRCWAEYYATALVQKARTVLKFLSQKGMLMVGWLWLKLLKSSGKSMTTCLLN